MKANLALLLIALLLAAGGAELALRMSGKFEPPEYPPTPSMPDLYESKPGYGYALQPNRTGTYEYPPAEPRTITVRSDAYGFRNTHDISELDGRLRVLVLGDSYTFGEGVQEGERFTDYLQEMEPGWRVDNIGIPGYGPDLMLFALEAVIPVARPDVVVVVLFFDDFRRVRPRFSGLGYANPRLQLEEGRLVEVEFPKPKPWERSHLYNALQITLSGRINMRAPLTQEEWALNEAIQDSLIALIEAHGATPMYAYLSGPWTIPAQQRRRDWMEHIAAELGVAYVDLTDPIQSADVPQVYLPDNGHYGPAGHGIVADSLHTFMLDRVLDTAEVSGDPAASEASTPQM